MYRHTIRFRPDGDGFRYEVRDPGGAVVRTGWFAGEKSIAQAAARTARADLREDLRNAGVA